MLKIAYPYRGAIQILWQSVVHTDKYKYYNAMNYWDYEIKLSASSWDDIAMVSVDKDGSILGMLHATIGRCANKISNVGIINFGETSYTFSKDLYLFLDSLFTNYTFRKIEWTVVIGNPAEKMYDKIIAKYGGRIVGTEKESVMLENGEYCDLKLYEMFKEDYMKNRKPLKAMKG